MYKQLYRSGYLLMICFFGILASCNIEQVSDDLDPTEISSRMGEEGCQVQITGKVVSTQDLLGVGQATINSSQFSEPVVTDEDGNFQIELHLEDGEDIQQAEVEVELEGYLTNVFTIDLSQVLNQADCSLLTMLTWDIGLTPLENSFEVSSTQPTSVVIEDTVAVVVYNTDGMGNITSLDTVQQVDKYRIEIPSITTNQATLVNITPNHNFVYGLGIVRMEDNRAVIGDFHLDATPDALLNGKIRIIFQSRTPIDSGDVIDFSNEQSYIVGFDTNNDILTILTGSFEDFTVYNNSNTVSANPSFAALGAVSGEQQLANCNCGEPVSSIYMGTFNNSSFINIDFPAGTPAEVQTAVYQTLFDFLNVNISENESTISLPVVVDKCEVLDISIVSIGVTESGEIFGYPYTFTSFSGGSVEITSNTCPTTSACHQGCP